ncbi:class I SAM-dependent methyltransferase [Myxococcota bacterium]
MFTHSLDSKRTADLPPEQVQEGNRTWWTQNPMAYDWRGELTTPRLSEDWFRAIDARFIHGARLFATEREPFDRIIPFERLGGKRVLEIGCGMGLHTELMTRAGALVTAVDLADASVEATQRRMEMRGLQAKVLRADAEQLDFDADSFDFVWSWGVIHHSARTARIVRTIARVLCPAGECRIMVYNRDGIGTKLVYIKEHLLRAGFLRRTFEETLFRTTDGFSARYYVRDQFEDLLRAFFDEVRGQILGQDSDAVPLPRKLRGLALRFASEEYLREAQARRGGFLFVTASGPR